MNKEYQELIKQLSVKANKGLDAKTVNAINAMIKRMEEKQW